MSEGLGKQSLKVIVLHGEMLLFNCLPLEACVDITVSKLCSGVSRGDFDSQFALITTWDEVIEPRVDCFNQFRPDFNINHNILYLSSHNSCICGGLTVIEFLENDDWLVSSMKGKWTF